MDDVKKEDALDIATPPGGPCRPALPGLTLNSLFQIDCPGQRIVIPEEAYDGAYWDLVGEAPQQKKVFIVLLKKGGPK